MSKLVRGRASAIPLTTDTTVIKAAASDVRIQTVVVYNATAGAIVAIVNAREAGEAAGALNEIANEAIAARGRLKLEGNPLLILARGGQISVNGAAAGLNAWGSGESTD